MTTARFSGEIAERRHPTIIHNTQHSRMRDITRHNAMCTTSPFALITKARKLLAHKSSGINWRTECLKTEPAHKALRGSNRAILKLQAKKRPNAKEAAKCRINYTAFTSTKFHSEWTKNETLNPKIESTFGSFKGASR